jgi:phosphoglycolate phosphatase
MLTYQTVLLDFDGTLVDSAPGIVSTIAYALTELGRPVPPMKDLLRWVGPPLPESFEIRAGLSPSEITEAIAIYRTRYLDVGVYDGKIFDGMGVFLKALREAGAHIALATSKPSTPASIMMEHFTLSPYFDVIACAADDETRGRKDEVIEDALAGLQRTVAESGARSADVEALRAEMAQIARGLGALAPRDSLARLETSVRDLAGRIDDVRRSGAP